MNNDLLKSIKHRLVDLGLDNKKAGNYTILLPHVEKELGKKLGIKNFSMAMSGYRATAPYQEMLTALQKVLADWDKRAA